MRDYDSPRSTSSASGSGDPDKSGSSTSDSSTLRNETPASMTQAILERIDPGALPPRVKAAMPEIGPYLWTGYTLAEIASRLDPPRSEEWASARVAEARRAIAAQVLENAGDELDPALRPRLERYVSARTDARMQDSRGGCGTP
jgi:hypothetical protein